MKYVEFIPYWTTEQKALINGLILKLREVLRDLPRTLFSALFYATVQIISWKMHAYKLWGRVSAGWQNQTSKTIYLFIYSIIFNNYYWIGSLIQDEGKSIKMNFNKIPSMLLHLAQKVKCITLWLIKII